MKISHIVLIVSVVIFALSSQASGTLRQEKCRLPMTTGRCFGYVPSFAYDRISGKCEEFIYGGCGGNENRFNTKRECEKSCRGV